jgi:hypothetical protein
MFVSQFDEILSTALFPTVQINYTATATNSANYQRGPMGIIVFSSQLCYIEIGEGVTATTSSFPIYQNTPYRIKVPAGTGAPWRVSAIRNGTDGTLWVRPINFN